jgi:hypothetical protein
MAWKRLAVPDQREIAQRRRAKRSRFLIDESLGQGRWSFFNTID